MAMLLPVWPTTLSVRLHIAIAIALAVIAHSQRQPRPRRSQAQPQALARPRAMHKQYNNNVNGGIALSIDLYAQGRLNPNVNVTSILISESIKL